MSGALLVVGGAPFSCPGAGGWRGCSAGGYVRATLGVDVHTLVDYPRGMTHTVLELPDRPDTSYTLRQWAGVPAGVSAVWTSDEFGEGIIAWNLRGGGWRPTYSDGSVGDAVNRRGVATYGWVSAAPFEPLPVGGA